MPHDQTNREYIYIRALFFCLIIDTRVPPNGYLDTLGTRLTLGSLVRVISHSHVRRRYSPLLPP